MRVSLTFSEGTSCKSNAISTARLSYMTRLMKRKLSFELDELQERYFGYQCGSNSLCIPWDVNTAMEDGRLRDYWLATGRCSKQAFMILTNRSNEKQGDSDFIIAHITAASNQFKTNLVALLNGEAIPLPMTWRAHLM